MAKKHTNHLIRLQWWEWRNQVQNLVIEGFTQNKKHHICGFYREKGNPKIEYYHWLSDAEISEFLSCNETVPEWSYAEQDKWLNKKFDIDPEELLKEYWVSKFISRDNEDVKYAEETEIILALNETDAVEKYKSTHTVEDGQIVLANERKFEYIPYCANYCGGVRYHGAIQMIVTQRNSDVVESKSSKPTTHYAIDELVNLQHE